jgi:hypothetical protein
LRINIVKLFSKQVVAMLLPKGHQIKHSNIGEYKFIIAYENKMLLFNTHENKMILFNTHENKMLLFNTHTFIF